MNPPIRPAALRPGARVALIAPAGPLAPEAIERALGRVRDAGWEPLLARHARGRHGYLAGTDAERLADLHAALRAPENEAIWCLRGGYGTLRLLESVDWDPLLRRPRPLIGFSDNTALHLALARRGLVSFHGPHAAAAELSEFGLEQLRRLLTEADPLGRLRLPAGAEPAQTMRGGVAEGVLRGGNLSLIAATLGTPFALAARGAIIVLEEVGEPLYRIDRLLTQLRLAGVFDEAAGVAVGAVSECPDDGDARLPAALDVVGERLADLPCPVAVGFPFGHIADSWTLPLGVRARLDADAGTLELLEPAAARG